MENINKRRSIRNFTGEAVSPEQLDAILRAAMQAPSAGNQRPWEFLVLRDEADRTAVSKMSPYASAAASADVVVILLINSQRLKYPENREQDMGACAQNLLLETVNQGLGAVWLGVAPIQDRMDHISSHFSLPENLSPFAAIPIGHPAGPSGNRFVDRFEEERIHYGKL